MRECWINVYAKPLYKSNYGKPCDSYIQALAVSYNVFMIDDNRTVYRIHVRMK